MVSNTNKKMKLVFVMYMMRHIIFLLLIRAKISNIFGVKLCLQRKKIIYKIKVYNGPNYQNCKEH